MLLWRFSSAILSSSSALNSCDTQWNLSQHRRISWNGFSRKLATCFERLHQHEQRDQELVADIVVIAATDSLEASVIRSSRSALIRHILCGNSYER